MKTRWIIMVISMLIVTPLLSGCGVIDVLLKPSMPTVPPSQATLRVMTHDSFYVSDTIIYDFEKEHSITLEFVRSGDTGAALNRAILSKDSPQADVFYGVDNTFLSRALEADIFESYDSPMLAHTLDELKYDGQNEALPVDFGEVCINYDKAYFSGESLAVPQTLEDLLKPEYEGMLAVENPATSSPGLAFLLATLAKFGEDGYLEYWQALRDNGLVVVNDWETAYYTNFSASSGQGPQPMVVSYGTSPAAEVYFAEEKPEEAPTASIVGPGTCFRQIEYVGILRGTHQRELAEKFIDYMLDYRFQEDIPLQMFVFPANGDARLPDVFIQHIQMADQPAQIDMELIAKNRDAWIAAWDEVVLR
jgi:thiamine transport system substrate-binding protein